MLATMKAVRILHTYPYLRVRNAAAAIAFYSEVFGAVETLRLAETSGRIGHAELRIGETAIMLADEHPELGIVGPATLGGTSVGLHLHVTNVDALAQKAVAAGATITRPLQKQFYGERTCAIRDPFGHDWLLGEQIEEVSPTEMQRRYWELTKPPNPPE